MNRYTSLQEASAVRPDVALDPLWGLGEVLVDGRSTPVPITWDDMDRDIAWARTALLEHGIGRGDSLVLVAGANEGGWAHAFLRAAAELGAASGMAWSVGFDARRVSTLCRRLRPALAIGLTAATVATLADLDGGIAGSLGGVGLVLARADARDALAAAGIRAGVFDLVGPVPVIDGPACEGAAYDESSWTVEVDPDSHLVVTPAPHRGFRLARFDSGRLGRVVDGTPARVVLAEVDRPAPT